MTIDPKINELHAELRQIGERYEQIGNEYDEATRRLEEVVVRALQAGIRQGEVATEIGRPREAVRRIARRHGIT